MVYTLLGPTYTDADLTTLINYAQSPENVSMLRLSDGRLLLSHFGNTSGTPAPPALTIRRGIWTANEDGTFTPGPQATHTGAGGYIYSQVALSHGGVAVLSEALISGGTRYIITIYSNTLTQLYQFDHGLKGTSFNVIDRTGATLLAGNLNVTGNPSIARVSDTKILYVQGFRIGTSSSTIQRTFLLAGRVIDLVTGTATGWYEMDRDLNYLSGGFYNSNERNTSHLIPLDDASTRYAALTFGSGVTSTMRIVEIKLASEAPVVNATPSVIGLGTRCFPDPGFLVRTSTGIKYGFVSIALGYRLGLATWDTSAGFSGATNVSTSTFVLDNIYDGFAGSGAANTVMNHPVDGTLVMVGEGGAGYTVVEYAALPGTSAITVHLSFTSPSAPETPDAFFIRFEALDEYRGVAWIPNKPTGSYPWAINPGIGYLQQIQFQPFPVVETPNSAQVGGSRVRWWGN